MPCSGSGGADRNVSNSQGDLTERVQDDLYSPFQPLLKYIFGGFNGRSYLDGNSLGGCCILSKREVEHIKSTSNRTHPAREDYFDGTSLERCNGPLWLHPGFLSTSQSQRCPSLCDSEGSRRVTADSGVPTPRSSAVLRLHPPQQVPLWHLR